ncbi:hypothetical protein HZA97_01090 [Candidatus Woesearchaeota archaeon]|nr:hypothetical protein [Candidatus Woesearchaeota archaeon]
MNNQILGDKKKSNFDDNLADKVNKIFDSQPEEVIKGKQTVSLAGISIYRPSEWNKSYDEWVLFFAKKNKKMVSMSDYYHELRQRKLMLKHDKEKQKADEILGALRIDAQFSAFTGGGLASKTWIDYVAPTQNEVIIIDKIFISEKITNFETRKAPAPIFGDQNSQDESARIKGDILLKELLAVYSGRAFIKSLFFTTDSDTEILETFKFFGDITSDDKIKVSFPKVDFESEFLSGYYLPIIKIYGGVVEIVLSEQEIKGNVPMWGKNE